MADFDKAVTYVLGNEGGFVDNENDSGGVTNFGISLRFLRAVSRDNLARYGVHEPVTHEAIRDMSLAQAKEIYKGEFWEHARFSEIQSQRVASYIFDMAVNHGTAQAIKLVQRAIWSLYGVRNCIKDDGVLGPKTLDEINWRGNSMLPVIMAVRAGYYMLLAEKRPKDKVFLEGWLNRVYQV